MKTKKILSLILAVTILACIFIMPANAAEAEPDEHIEIIIVNQDLSEEAKERIIAFYTNGVEEKDGSATYGLTCTLLGHKIESSIVYQINHEVRATAPRCLKKTYHHDICTRCDYSKSTLVSSAYIACC